jgi:hypothetical protein
MTFNEPTLFYGMSITVGSGQATRRKQRPSAGLSIVIERKNEKIVKNCRTTDFNISVHAQFPGWLYYRQLSLTNAAADLWALILAYLA